MFLAEFGITMGMKKTNLMKDHPTTSPEHFRFNCLDCIREDL